MMSEGDKWKAAGFFLFVAVVILFNLHRAHEARRCRKCEAPFSGRKVDSIKGEVTTSQGYSLDAERGWHRDTTKSWTVSTNYRCKKCGATWWHTEQHSKTKRR